MALRSVRTRVELLAGRADQLGPAIINSPAAMSSSPAVAGQHKAGRPTMKRDLQVFLLSVGGLLAAAGSGLLVLWAVLS
jgi:hypothetical protein